MSKKEKLKINRTDNFESVDEELSEAMALLDETNARVLGLLEGEEEGDPEEAGQTVPASEDAPEPAPDSASPEGGTAPHESAGAPNEE